MSDLYPVNVYKADQVIWEGIKKLSCKKSIYLGSSGNNGIYNIGTVEYSNEKNNTLNYPNSYSTRLYGIDYKNICDTKIVGTYTIEDSCGINAFIYTGGLNDKDISKAKNFDTIVSGGKYTYVHAISNKLAVGNCDNPTLHGKNGLPLGPATGFIYNIENKNFINVLYPGSETTNVYGIVYNGNHKYTICGAYSSDLIGIESIYGTFYDSNPYPFGKAFMVNYNSKKNKFYAWTTFEYPYGSDFNTSFTSISKLGQKYSLAANSMYKFNPTVTKSSWVQVEKTVVPSFTAKIWLNFKVPKIQNVHSANGVSENQTVGEVLKADYSFVAVTRLADDFTDLNCEC